MAAPKKGFSVPLRDWFKEDNLNNKLKEMLLSNNDNLGYTSKGIEKLIDENKDGKSDFGNFIWMVIVLRKWLDSVTQSNEKQPAILNSSSPV